MSVFPPSPGPGSWNICLSSLLYGFRGLTSLLNQFVFSLKYSNSIEWITAPLLHEAIEKAGILETFSNDNSFDQPPFSKQRVYQARVIEGAPFCHDPKITGQHQPRVGACLIGTQARFCTAWTLEPVLGFAFICFYMCQVELLEARKRNLFKIPKN